MVPGLQVPFIHAVNPFTVVADYESFSRHVFAELVRCYPDESHGVTHQMANFFFTKLLTHPDMKGQLDKMEEIKKLRLPGFLHDPSLIQQHNIMLGASIVDAYRHKAPVVRIAPLPPLF